MRKRILSLLMTVAITLTFSMPMSVFAASASLTLEEAKWTAEDEITVKFGQNVSVSDDVKDKVLAKVGYSDEYEKFAQSVTADGNKVIIKVNDTSKKYGYIKFQPGSLMDVNGSANSSDIEALSITADSSLAGASLDKTSLTSEGGTVKAVVTGTLLSKAGYYYQLKNAADYQTVSGVVSFKDANTAEVTFKVPENTTSAEVKYVLQYSTKAYYGFKTIGDNSVTVAAAGGSGETPAQSITSWSANQTSFDNNGGKVTVSIKGTGLKSLDKSAFEIELKGQYGWMTQEYDVKHSYTASDDQNATVEFTLPKNTGNDAATYRIGPSKAYKDKLNCDAIQFTVAGKTAEVKNPEITKMEKIDGVMPVDGKGGSVEISITGTNLKSLTEKDFAVVEKDTDKDAGVALTYTAADDSSATLRFTLGANNTEFVKKYVVRALKGATADVGTVEVFQNKKKNAATFKVETDDVAAYKFFKPNEDGSTSDELDKVEITFKKLSSVTVSENWKDLIYFYNGWDDSGNVALTKKPTVEGNTVIIDADGINKATGWIMFKAGAIENQDGATLANSTKFYLKSGATVTNMSYNRITFGAQGGEVVATVTGKNLTSSTPALSAKVFMNNGTAVNSLKAETKVISDEKAEIRVQLPENKTRKVQTYRIMPVVNGMNTYAAYIKGYDVISVVPEGEDPDDNKARLASVELSGGNDTNDAVDEYDTEIRSTDFTLKFDAIIRGTNLSAKKTAVKVVDENGIEWPVAPVKECGATIRWQRSSSFMKDRDSKNEQRIEFLAPRLLGTTHTYTMYFAVDGENYDNDTTAKIVIRNNGVYDASLGFSLDDLGVLKTGKIKYVDTEGNEIAPEKDFKGYGVTELYKIGAETKNIEGYKFSKCNVNTNWFVPPTFDEEKQEYVFEHGQHFVRDLKGNDVVFTYEKVGESKPASMKAALSTSSYTYTGKTRTPSVKVSVNGKVLRTGDYTVKYASGRKNVGKYSVKVTLKSGDKTSKTLYFKILPKKTSIKKVTKAKKAFTVKWSKQTKQVSGYQVQYSTSKKFTAKTTKVKTIKSYKTTSKKVTKLKKKKTYHTRVRTYKTVKGTKYYSGWSKAKSVKTK